MKFYLHIASVLLSSFVLGVTFAESHQPVEISVTSTFSDKRHVTFACLSYKPFGPHQLLALNFPSDQHVLWTNQQYDGETLQKCHMMWRENGMRVRSVFEAFVGRQNHDDATDDYTKEVKYIWVVSEYGLSRYSFIMKDYFRVKTLEMLQYIGVHVVNFLGGGQKISILCISKREEAASSSSSSSSTSSSGLVGILALDSVSNGGSVAWGIKDFDRGTTQVCRVEFDRREGIVFDAFLGSWDHDLVSILDAVVLRRRMYHWILRDTGLYQHNYHTGTEDFVQRLPN